MKIHIGILISFFFWGCSGPDREPSEIKSGSIVADQNFIVQSTTNQDPNSTAARDILISVAQNHSSIAGLKLTTVNPYQLGSDVKVQYLEAKSLCSNLSYAGLQVWRLPTLNELTLLRGFELHHLGVNGQPLTFPDAIWANDSLDRLLISDYTANIDLGGSSRRMFFRFSHVLYFDMHHEQHVSSGIYEYGGEIEKDFDGAVPIACSQDSNCRAAFDRFSNVAFGYFCVK